MSYIEINSKQIEARIQTRRADAAWGGRATKAVTLAMTPAEAVASFTDGAAWSYVDDNGVKTDLGAYAIAGSVTDNRDGTVTVKMGKYTQEELLAIPLGAVPQTPTEAAALREILMGMAARLTDDGVAVQVKGLYPDWGALVKDGHTATEAGYRFRYEGKLYKTCVAGIVFQASHVPGVGTESLFTCIDEEQAGTAADPIPYGGNMELCAGSYYTQSGVLYRCFRDSGAPIQQALGELVDLYVEVCA